MLTKKNTGFFLLLLFFLFSCHSSKEEDLLKNFDRPLLKESDKYYRSGNYKEFIALQNKYFKIANEKGYEGGKALVYLQLSDLNDGLKEYKKSLYFLNKADTILKNSDNESHKALLYNRYLMNNFRLNIFDNALFYSNKALKSISKIKDKETKKDFEKNAYLKRSIIFLYQAKYDSAYSSLFKAQKINDDFSVESAFVVYYFYTPNSKADSMGVHLNKAQEMLRNEKELTPYHRAIGHVTMGAYYSTLKRYDEAEKEYNKALEESEKYKNTVANQVSIYEALISFYKSKGDAEKEKYYTDLYAKTKLKEDKEIQQIINPAVNKFIADSSELEAESKRRMWILISLLGILCIVIAIYSYKQLSSLKQKKKQLTKEAQLLKERIGDQKYDEMIALAKKNNSAFLEKFQEVYPDFVNKLKAINPEMESSELAFAALIKLNFTSKEIASFIFIEHSSVQQRKRRLRKKLNLSSEVDLYKYFNEL